MNEDMVALDAIKTRAPFSSLFAVDIAIRDRIAADMRDTGFDPAHPLVVWNDGDRIVLIDGHTRLAAARTAGLREVPICEETFSDDLDALGYVLHSQQARRNLSPAEMMQAITIVDATKRKQQGGDRGNQYTKPDSGKTSNEVLPESSELSVISAEETATIVGTSRSMVERVRSIQSDPIATEDVQQGKSISAAAAEARARKKAEKMEAVAVKKDEARAERDAPWKDAAAAGRAQEAHFRDIEKGLRIAFDAMEKQGTDLATYFASKDQRVTSPWNKAYKQAKLCVRIMREAMKDSETEE